MTLDALLLQPPFFRLLGSHNDRAPLELAYLNGYLIRNGLSTLILNADWTGAKSHIRWSKLFENSKFFERAVDGDSPIYDETIERVISFDPRTVILAAGDSITPWVDLGNAYFTAELSKRLMQYGIYTIGVGPFFSKIPDKFSSSFSTILVGSASPSISKIVQNRPPERVIHGEDIDLSNPPVFHPMIPDSRADVFMTAIGCPFHCTFCLGADSGSVKVPNDVIFQDVSDRVSSELDVGDAIFSLNTKRVYELAELLSPLGKSFACEVSTSTVNEKSLIALKSFGVRTVKLGVETANYATLLRMNKRQTLSMIADAAALIRKHGFYFVVYLLLGGTESDPSDAVKTLDFCKVLQPDDLVVNVMAYSDMATRDFRYDSHFSMRLARQWCIADVLPSLFELQSDLKVGLGRLI